MDNNKKSMFIEVSMRDKTASGFKTLKSNMEGTKNSSSSMTGSFFKAGLALEALKVGARVAGQAITFVSQQMQEMAVRGGLVQDVMVGFNRSFENSEEALNDLRRASNGMISDYDLMLSANKAVMLGVSTDSKQLARLLEVAAARGQALGVSTTQAFSDIVTGIGRMSPLILDNLGITTGAYQRQVEAIEATGRELTDLEKKQLLVNTVMADALTPIATATDTWEGLTARVQNLKDEMAVNLAPVLANLTESLFPSVESALRKLSDWITTDGVAFFEGFRKGWDDSKQEAEALNEEIERVKIRTAELRGSSNVDVKSIGETWSTTLFEMTTGFEYMWYQSQLSLESFKNSMKGIFADFEYVFTEFKKRWENNITKPIDNANQKVKDFLNRYAAEPLKVAFTGGEQRKAAGGIVQTSGMYRINEKIGGEDVYLPKGSKVIPADRSGGGNQTYSININVNGGITDMNLVNQLAGQVENIMAKNNKLARYGVI